MNFDNQVLTTIDIFGLTLWITETHLSTWIVMALLIVVALFARRAINNFNHTEAPTGKQNLIELMVETFAGFASTSLGSARKYGGWYFGVFVFVLASNLSGLLGLRPPTADLSTTLVISSTTFLIVQYVAFKTDAKGYLKGLFEPAIPFVILNVIGEFAIVASLALRLFGSILAGMIIVSIVLYLIPWWLGIGPITAALHFYFDVFAGAIQAFIITLLSMLFISQKTAD